MPNLDEVIRVREELLSRLVRSWKTLATLETEMALEMKGDEVHGSWDSQMAAYLNDITETTKDLVHIQDAIQRFQTNLQQHEERIQELSEGQEYDRDNLLVLFGDDME